jgi:hypothetical protein
MVHDPNLNQSFLCFSPDTIHYILHKFVKNSSIHFFPHNNNLVLHHKQLHNQTPTNQTAISRPTLYQSTIAVPLPVEPFPSQHIATLNSRHHKR